MSKHQGGIKGYEFSRQKCSGCGRSVAVSFDPDGRHVWLRRHKTFSASDYWCEAPRQQVRADG